MNSKIENHILSVVDQMKDNFSFGPTCWVIRYILQDSILRISFKDNHEIEIQIRKKNEDIMSQFNPSEPKLIEKLHHFKTSIYLKKQEEYTENALKIMSVQDHSFLAAFDLTANFEEYLLTLLQTSVSQFTLEYGDFLLFDHSIGNKKYRFRLSETRMRDFSVDGKSLSYDVDLKNMKLREHIVNTVLILKQERSTKIRDSLSEILKHNDKNNT